MKNFRILATGFALFALSACTAGITGKASYVDGKHEMSATTQNFIVGMRISLDDIKTTRVNDLLVANVQLRNKWSYTQDIHYRVHWFDQDGIEVAPERAVWNKLILTGKSERSVKLTAPQKSVTEVKVTIRD